MDPRTGRPVQGVLSVAVLTDTGTAGDALDDAFFVLGVEGSRRTGRASAVLEAIFFLPVRKNGWKMVRDIEVTPVNRRTFLRSLARRRRLACFVLPDAVGRTAEGEDHARPDLSTAEPQPAVQSEQHGRHGRDRHRHHRHRRRRREGHARAVRRDADRQESVPDRGDLAGGVHRLVLSAGPREGARARRARSRAVGHQGQGAWSAGARAARRQRRATTASATRPAARVRRRTPPARRV